MRLVPTLAIGLPLLACACSLFSPLDGFSDGNASNEGGGGATDGGNAPVDGSHRGEQGGPTDEGTPWCATHAATATFCADFDERGLDTFDDQMLDNGALVVDEGTSRSAPSSLWATAGSRRARVSAYAVKRVPGTVTRARVSFDVFVEGVHAEGAAEVVHLKFDRGDRNYTVGVGLGGGTRFAYAYEYSPSPDIYIDVVEGNPFPIATWVRITLTADLTARTVTFERDDEAGQATGPLAAPLSGGALALEVGIPRASTGEGAWKIRVDNVVLDAN